MRSQLIKKSVNLDLHDKFSYATALIVSLRTCDIDAANELIDHGANVNYPSDNIRNFTPLRWAFHNGLQDLAIKILDQINDLSILEIKNPAWFTCSILDYVYKLKLNKIIPHLKLLYRNRILMAIDDDQTIISKSYQKQNADLNVIDMITDFIYSSNVENKI